MPVSEDRRLLNEIAARDDCALGELYRRYYPRLERFIGKMTADRDGVADIINEVFLVIWQKAGTYRGDASPSTWILGIAHNKALKWASKNRKLEPLAVSEHSEACVESLVERDEIEQLMAHLSAEQRAVIELTYFFGYSYREIGEILECPENTVKTRMFHARRTLRKHISEDFR